MRIALCLSGLPRYVRECYELTRLNVMQGHDVDVFVHAWETDAAELEHVKHLYKPKFIETEAARKFTARGHSQSMWYSHTKCNDLRRRAESEEDKTYDLVVRHRTDLAVLEPVRYQKTHGVYARQYSDDELDDRFAFGTPEFMGIYADVYDYATDERMNQLHPEQALFLFLGEQRIPIHHLDLNCFIARTPGYGHYDHPDAERVMNQIRARL